METRPLGIDVSRYQGKIKWDIVANNADPVRFAGMRATISWGYTDGWFSFNWTEAKRVGIIRTAYHVLYPASDPQRQMDNFFRTVGDDYGELPLVLDVELDHNKSPDQIQAAILRCAAIIQSRTGKPALIYSRASWIDQFITANRTPPGWLNDFDWWLANYLRTPEEHPGPPFRPKGLIPEKVLIHQTTDRGKPIGVESKQLDYNRWIFGLPHLQNYTNFKLEPTNEDKMKLLWNAHPELHDNQQ